MTHTIGNPLSWTAQTVQAASRYLGEATANLGGPPAVGMPRLRPLTRADIGAALRAGWRDFMTERTDVMFLVLIYPAAGLVLIGLALHLSLLPLLVPLVTGFALLGPVAAVGLYEMSRRREAGLSASWLDALAVVRAPHFGAIVVMGLYLAALFLAWMITAHAIWFWTLGPEPPSSLTAFLYQVLGTEAGRTMAIAGAAAGFCFALTALAISVISFQLLLDRDIGVPMAIACSVRLLRRSPRVVLSWGALVAVLLLLGALPMLLGLIVVLPVLGHASWHLYRRAVI